MKLKTCLMIALKLEGPKLKHRPWWDPYIIIWYRLIALLRMVLVLSATAWTYLTKRLIPQIKLAKICFTTAYEIVHWIV